MTGPLPIEDLKRARDGLKDFQSRTVQTVIDRMFDPHSPQRRFLVADEVGLGKTKIARSLVAETIERLWNDKSVDRIDIIYICSNHQIARQNLRDLAILPEMRHNPVDRITMLPSALADLGTKRVNLVAFTPQTSLTFGNAGGRVGERAMLFHILEHPDVFGRNRMSRRGAHRLLTLGAPASFPDELWWARQVEIPTSVAKKYRAILRKKRLDREFDRMSDGRRNHKSHELHTFVGQLRRALAEACIDLLSPDLIILDEFQRFTGILKGEGDDGELARLLFEQDGARILLLSATPYRMLSQADDDESHFEGFERTVEFLLGAERAGERGVLRGALTELRRGMLGHRDPIRLAQARDQAQGVLRSVMVRTERLAATENRSGMLRDSREAACEVTSRDVEAFLGVDRMVQTLRDVPGMVEYWKSAPYLFNFMDEYKVRKEIDRRIDHDDGQIRGALNGVHMLDWSGAQRYRKVDPSNGRLRWLIDDLAGHSAFDILWMPPALAQTELAGAYAKADRFTKRLVFSGWTVVPRVVAALTSYERERRHHRRGRTQQTMREFSGRLVLPAQGERYAHLALLLPCRRLAELGNPLRVAREAGLAPPVPIRSMRKSVARALDQQLTPYIKLAPTTGTPSHRWYAAAQFLIDPDLQRLSPRDFVGEDRDSGALTDHWRGLMGMLAQPVREWGRPPKDLVEVLTDIALGGPGVSFLRALDRIERSHQSGPDDLGTAQGAARLAWSFRSVVNTSEADHMIMAGADRGEDFWRALLRHCVSGGLGSVLDEWLHLVPDQLRLTNSTSPVGDVVIACARVLRLGDGQVRAHVFGAGIGENESNGMRTHFAMRFGQSKGATAEGENPVDIRNAFNSPFHPFVLVSTSVGQEGLDFHHYAHAVVHWNLPTNPVDLEQREGRVHRYKNHAVRKNVAAQFGSAPAVVASDDPWRTVFELARVREDDLMPWWIYPGPAAIERLIPLLPMSREHSALRSLIEATSLYRMTMGQPRQAELIDVLAGLSEEEQEQVRSAIHIDLTPLS